MNEKFLGWMEDYPSPDEANVILFGVPIGRWSKQALENWRRVSNYVEIFDNEKGRNLLESILLADIGDVTVKGYPDFEQISTNVKSILDQKKVPVILGGGHLLSYYAFKVFPENTKLIVFDAHCDIKNNFMDEKIVDLDYIDENFKVDPEVNDTTWVRRVCDIRNPKNIMQIGLRSGDEFDFKFIKDSGITMITPNMLHKDIERCKKMVGEFTKGSDVYISVDMDGFDPSIAPAVDHPEPNGIMFDEFQEVISSVNGRIVGVDLVCLKPTPNNEVTEFTGVRGMFEILGKVGERIKSSP